MSHSNTPAQRDPIEIQQIPVAVLEPDPRNARTHRKQQVRQIGASIQEFGFVNPILIDEAKFLYAGRNLADLLLRMDARVVRVGFQGCDWDLLDLDRIALCRGIAVAHVCTPRVGLITRGSIPRRASATAGATGLKGRNPFGLVT